jgi:hypothetical protein
MTNQSWCILRTKPGSTLKLAASLAEDEFEVWTPVEVKRNRRPRRNPKPDPEPCAIMPTYVFADAGRLVDLLELAEMPVKPRRGKGRRLPAHDDFSVFHFHDRIPIVADVDLIHLRSEERDAASRHNRALRRVMAKGKGEPLDCGSVVRIPQGAFAGMSGQVVESDGKFTLVCFGRTEVKISTFILRADMANTFQAATDLAA